MNTRVNRFTGPTEKKWTQRRKFRNCTVIPVTIRSPANTRSLVKRSAWIKIHNLPDHVYFNHSQHIRAGKVQCQTCHGNITQMNEVKQFAELSMGWCINCHRTTKVNFPDSSGNGNKFYSIYEKFNHNLATGEMDSVTVENIGGTECQKCHY